MVCTLMIVMVMVVAMGLRVVTCPLMPLDLLLCHVMMAGVVLTCPPRRIIMAAIN